MARADIITKSNRPEKSFCENSVCSDWIMTGADAVNGVDGLIATSVLMLWATA